MMISNHADENDGTASTMAEPPINRTEPDLAQQAASLYEKKTTSKERPRFESLFEDNPTAGGECNAEGPSDPGTPDAPPVEDEAYLASQICVHWNKSFDSVLECGRLLEKAAAMMPRKAFRKKFVERLPFTYSVAQRLRNLAKSPRINDPKYRPYLPFSWNTLAAINTLSEDGFQHGVETGIISPKCQYKHVKKLRDEFPDPEESGIGSTSASAVPLSGRTKQLHDMKVKMAEWTAKPRPLFVWIASNVVEKHRSEWAKLVEDLNQRLPQEYPFISEVRTGEPK